MAEEKQSAQTKENQALTKVLKSELVVKSAESFGIDVLTLYGTLFRTVFPRDREGKIQGTLEQFVAFLAVAKQYNLNPFTKEIYAFPSKGGGVVPIVPIDGWVKLMQDRKDNTGKTLLDGIKYKDHIDDEGKMSAITCILKRKDMSEPIEVTEYMQECVRDTEPWKKWPRRMLRHKATIQCGRIAFGLAGIYDQDEAERILQAESAGQTVEGGEIFMPRRVETEQKQEPLTPKSYTQEPVAESKTRTVDPVVQQVTDILGHEPKIEDFGTGKVAAAVREANPAPEQTQEMKDAIYEAQTGHEPPDDDFDVVVPAAVAEPPAPEPEKKLKKDMTSAEVHLIPVYGEDKNKWPAPKKVLTGDYERVQAQHVKKLHVVMNAFKKRTEKDLYEKLWKEWAIESTKDIPRESYAKVLEWLGAQGSKS